MIHADQRRRLRQAVSLNRRIAQPSPELFSFRVKCRASTNEGPELPAELAPDVAENPPAMEKVFTLRLAKAAPKILDLFRTSGIAVFQIALDLLLQRLQYSWHAHQHRNPLSVDRAHDFRRLKLPLKNHRSA